LFFVVDCVFDPSNQILGGKVTVFIVLWAATLLTVLLKRGDSHLPLPQMHTGELRANHKPLY
jgi:hypothetical protein